MWLALLFFALLPFSVAAVKDNITEDNLFLTHVANQLYERLEVYGLDEMKRLLPAAVWAIQLAEKDTFAHGKALQVVGVTPDCYVYTSWLTKAIRNLVHFVDRNKPELRDYSAKKNQMCKHHIAVIMDTDSAGIKMTLFVVVDSYGRRLRVQNAMNGHWKNDNSIFWTKLRNSSLEWFYTQDLERGYTFDRLFVSGGEVFAYARSSSHSKFFRMKIFMGEDYVMRPYLVKEDDMTMDPRVSGPISFQITAMDNLYANFQRNYHCPFELLRIMESNKTAHKIEHTLPPRVMLSCHRQVSLLQKHNKETFELNNLHYLRFVDVYQNAVEYTPYPGFILQALTDEQIGSNLTLPIISLQTRRPIGFTSNEAPGGYTWISQNAQLRLKNQRNDYDDSLTIYRIDDYVQGCSKTKVDQRLLKTINDYRIKFQCYIDATREATDPKYNDPFISFINSHYLFATCKEIVDDDHLRKKELWEWQRLELQNTILASQWLLAGNNLLRCNLTDKLLYRVTSKRFLNQDHFHLRMTHPHVVYKSAINNKFRNRHVRFYAQPLTQMFVGICLLGTVVLVAIHCVAQHWKKNKRYRPVLKKKVDQSTATD